MFADELVGELGDALLLLAGFREEEGFGGLEVGGLLFVSGEVGCGLLELLL